MRQRIRTAFSATIELLPAGAPSDDDFYCVMRAVRVGQADAAAPGL